MTASIGVSTGTPKQGEEVTVLHDLLKAANEVLYHAKHEGQNHVKVAPTAPASAAEPAAECCD